MARDRIADMRLFSTLAAAVAVVMTLVTAAEAQPLSVHLDQSTRVTLPTAARDVVVGNAAIADVAMLDGRNILVLGKSYGVTSLMVTDVNGRTILNTQVVVSAADDGRVSFYRGGQVQTYACAQRCETITPSAGGAAAPAASSASAAAPAGATASPSP